MYYFDFYGFLRSGNVTYTDIVRRERFHPPVRKILLKLGVQRATDIKSDEQLRKVIADIVMKKGSSSEDSKPSMSSKETQHYEIIEPGTPIPIVKVQDKKTDSESLKPESRTVGSSKDNKQQRKPDDYEVFRRLILAVHSQNGRVRAALSSVRPSPHVGLERLIVVVNAVCAIAGSTRLFKTLTEAEVSTAFNTYWYGRSKSTDDKESPRAVAISNEAISSPAEHNNASEFDDDAQYDDVVAEGDGEEDDYAQEGEYEEDSRAEEEEEEEEDEEDKDKEEDATENPFELQIQYLK